MANSIGTRLVHAWNAFFNKDPTYDYSYPSYNSLITSYRPDRVRLLNGNDRTIVTSVYSRIAMDVASLSIQHVRLDENKRFMEEIDSSLNTCFTWEANKDQTPRSFLMDAVLSLFDEGCIAIVPVDTKNDPFTTTSFDILSMRTGKIIEWRPDDIKVRLYNDRTGQKEDLLLPKRMVAIIDNPFYAVMNEPSSTVKRLTRKLALLDAIDEQSGSGKLDLIIQLPYVIKTEARRAQAERRRKEIEMQLAGSKYGIAYTDGTEHITQLNRSLENHLMDQIKYLTDALYSQLGITQEIMNGTADEAVMNNYYKRTIEPVISAIVDELKRKFISKTARAQRQTIMFFNEPFKLVAAGELANIADKFTRNEIMTSNEVRQIVGLKPSSDPNADVLRNKNLNQSKQAEAQEMGFGNQEEQNVPFDFPFDE